VSDYISKSAFIEDIKNEITNLAMNGLKGTPRSREELYQLIERIEEQPTLDEKEIIRKAFERVVEKLEGLRAKPTETVYDTVLVGSIIEIVKEECGINE
jgi:hypothetical protein